MLHIQGTEQRLVGSKGMQVSGGMGPEDCYDLRHTSRAALVGVRSCVSTPLAKCALFSALRANGFEDLGRGWPRSSVSLVSQRK